MRSKASRGRPRTRGKRSLPGTNASKLIASRNNRAPTHTHASAAPTISGVWHRDWRMSRALIRPRIGFAQAFACSMSQNGHVGRPRLAVFRSTEGWLTSIESAMYARVGPMADNDQKVEWWRSRANARVLLIFDGDKCMHGDFEMGRKIEFPIFNRILKWGKLEELVGKFACFVILWIYASVQFRTNHFIKQMTTELN